MNDLSIQSQQYFVLTESTRIKSGHLDLSYLEKMNVPFLSTQFLNIEVLLKVQFKISLNLFR